MAVTNATDGLQAGTKASASDPVATDANQNVSSAEKIELTDREKAIARGDDPDAVAPVTTQPKRQAAEAEGGSATQPQTQPATQPTSQAPSQSSINDDVKIVAGSLGLSNDKLKEFSSADEFLRFSRLTDRRIAGLANAPHQQEPGQGQLRSVFDCHRQPGGRLRCSEGFPLVKAASSRSAQPKRRRFSMYSRHS